MFRRLSIPLMIVLLLTLLSARPALAAKSYFAERFDVQIDLQENGSAIVTETIEFHFEGGPFTFAFREVSGTETDGITFLEASMDGVSMPQGTEAGQVEVQAGDPLKVTWHFVPTSDEAHVFTLRYRADGVIRKSEADTLIWRAVPEEHDYRIAHSTITVTYPQEAALLGQPTLDWNFDSAWEEHRILLTASDIAEDEDLILTVNFAPNSLTRAIPQWQVRQEQTKAVMAKALPVGFMAAIGTLLLGGLGLYTYIRANRRDLNVSPVVPTPNPPSDLPAAVVGKLTKQQHTFMGEIFDLAQRGVLEVREEKSFLGTRNHILERKEHTIPLKPYEQGLLEALFKPGETQISMNQIGSRLGTRSKLYDEPLEQELIRRGWLDTERKQRQVVLAVVGVLGMIVALLGFIASLIFGARFLSSDTDLLLLVAAVAGISAAAFLLTIPFLIYAGTYSVLTPTGEELAARWKGFADYLKQASKGKEPAIRPDYFERYLAYAAVFGLGASWTRYFKELGGVPLPVWFHAMAGSDGDFSAMVAVMSASDSAGSSASAGGGAGASGGGASGAG